MKIKITASCIIDSNYLRVTHNELEFLNADQGYEAFEQLQIASGCDHDKGKFECKAEELPNVN